MPDRGNLATALGAVAMLVLLIGALVVAASADQADRAAPQSPAASGST
ncbi:MAG: hypothetical protein KA098_02200 [Phenylobacterium sp.]|nr:hypothetical protein [Phenylobacterium sp.]